MKIFPDLAHQDEIKFLFIKSIPYNKRVALIICCMVAGLTVQLFFSFWLGWFLLALATAMILIQGYDLKPVAKSRSEKWDQVTPDEYTKVNGKQKDLARWDLDAFDITNPLGGTIFVILGIAALLIWLVLLDQRGNIGNYWAWDCLVLLAPYWVTGVRRYLRQNQLLIKINMLEKIMAEFTAPSDIQVRQAVSHRRAVDVTPGRGPGCVFGYTGPDLDQFGTGYGLSIPVLRLARPQ